MQVARQSGRPRKPSPIAGSLAYGHEGPPRATRSSGAHGAPRSKRPGPLVTFLSAMRGAELLGAGNAAAGRFIPVGVVDSVAAHDPCAVRVHERDWHSIAITSAVRLVGSKQPRLPEESRQPGRPIPLERSEISARPRDATERRVYRPLESRWEFLNPEKGDRRATRAASAYRRRSCRFAPGGRWAASCPGLASRGRKPRQTPII